MQATLMKIRQITQYHIGYFHAYAPHKDVNVTLAYAQIYYASKVPRTSEIHLQV
jgi:hypothetical protein